MSENGFMPYDLLQKLPMIVDGYGNTHANLVPNGILEPSNLEESYGQQWVCVRLNLNLNLTYRIDCYDG